MQICSEAALAVPHRGQIIDSQTSVPESRYMTAGEFIRRVTALGSARGVPVRFDATRGKGSHGTLYYGDRFTVVKDRRKECGPGLLNKMLGDLGLRRRDLR
jgi:mRNA interferase HicA